MTKKLNYKNKVYLIDENDDENETVDWNDEIQIKKYFDCGCCDECLCDDSMSCKNCGCNCNGEDYDDYNEESDDEDESDEYDSENTNHDENNLQNFDINIIKSNDNEKKVRITIELNLDSKKNEIISIDLDINSSTYLKIAEELFKS
jgi:hypothetical protein